MMGPSPNPAYIGMREDIRDLVPDSARTILDVGCAQGALGKLLVRELHARVWGIEYDDGMCAEAKKNLTGAWRGDLNRDPLASFEHPAAYDLIIFADILEHLMEPGKVLKEACGLLASDGHIITSIPNVNHYSTLFSLLFLQKWPYRKRGIHDQSHLRFFTRRNLTSLYHDAGLKVVKEKRNLRLWESEGPLDILAKLVDFFPLRSYVTFQYLHLLTKA
ncbi:class I SAM-dependent methyltransferase [Fibrobacterota bacterium]